MTDRFEFAEFHALSTVTGFGSISASGRELPARHFLAYGRAARQLLLDPSQEIRRDLAQEQTLATFESIRHNVPKLTSEVTMPDDFIAMRRLDLAGETPGEVTVGIKRPVLDDGPYKCEYQIVGIGGGKVRAAMGGDSMQALVLALQAIGAELYTSEDAKEGRLTWFGSPNLGFPVSDVIADLVPKDSRPIGMLFDFRYAPDEWHRTIDCADWPSAREIAIGSASGENVEWIEIHEHGGPSETWRHVNGKWEQANP